jgi:hypothetical protein
MVEGLGSLSEAHDQLLDQPISFNIRLRAQRSALIDGDPALEGDFM